MGRIVPKEILYFEELTSTNDYAHRVAKEGYGEGTVIIAKTQTKGRGRLGRGWYSPEGGIYLSLILHPKISIKNSPILSLLGGVSVAKAIRGMFGIDAGMKWPNDLLINMRKAGGVLVEMETSGKRIDFVILGIGVNVNISKERLPERTIWPSTSIMEEIGKTVDQEELIERILIEFDQDYLTFIKDGPGGIIKDWKRIDLFLNKSIIVRTNKGKIQGESLGIDRDGAYRVRLSSGTTMRIVTGEIIGLVGS